MKKFTVLFVLGFTLTCSAIAHAADNIPVKRVILSTSGLANFELRAPVKNDATLKFPVRLEQVDDILKSLVVFDEKGSLGGVTLPGKQPLAQIFKDLPFTQKQLQNPMLLLNAYQGAGVTIKEAGASVTGKILHVAAEQIGMDEVAVTRHRISLMTDAGLKQVVLEDAQAVQFKDKKVRNEIMRALDALRENAASGRRVLSVHLNGKGSRDVALSYVVDAPLWKAAYRMVLPEKDGDKGLLQGWAIVENMTATDWNNVDMTLVSGNPVTYKQSLYESYYVSRPNIPVQVFGRVMPRKDTGTVASAAETEMDDELYSLRNENRRMKTSRSAAMPQAMAMMDSVGGMALESVAASPSVMAKATNAAQSSEATTQVLFRFPNTFSLKSGQSLMLPFVSRSLNMERVSVYQPETHPRHPLAAVSITNDGETGLPPGILTLYEESAALKGTGFIGDAELPMLSAGEKRLVSYALDSKTQINRENKYTSTDHKISIDRGVIRTQKVQISEAKYTVKAPAKEARTVILEHPKQHGYTLQSPDPKNVEVTKTHYRIRVPVKAGGSETITVSLQRTNWQSYTMTNLSTHQLVSYSKNSAKLPAKALKYFERLAKMRRSIDTINRQIKEAKSSKDRIFKDQARIRENLKSLSGRSDVQQKYLEKLSAQEDKIAGLDKKIAKWEQERSVAEKKMSAVIAEMKF